MSTVSWFLAYKRRVAVGVDTAALTRGEAWIPCASEISLLAPPIPTLYMSIRSTFSLPFYSRCVFRLGT